MTDESKTILSVIATTASRLSDLEIKDGQLLFIQDKSKIALDFKGKRKFYNQIEVLSTDIERQSLESAVNGLFYFVIGTAILWIYQDGWIQVTSPPQNILQIGTTFPDLGAENTLYIDKSNKSISIWDPDLNSYSVIANKTEIAEITNEDIDSLFQ